MFLTQKQHFQTIFSLISGVFPLFFTPKSAKNRWKLNLIGRYLDNGFTALKGAKYTINYRSNNHFKPLFMDLAVERSWTQAKKQKFSADIEVKMKKIDLKWMKNWSGSGIFVAETCKRHQESILDHSVLISLIFLTQNQHFPTSFSLISGYLSSFFASKSAKNLAFSRAFKNVQQLGPWKVI